MSNALEQLTDGTEAVYTVAELEKRLQADRPMRVKLGMDPTAPDLTLGHTVVLRKLRQFQDLGHKAVLIIGDYTALIGDPTGRSKTRPMLTPEQIKQNGQSYFDQAGKILDLSADKIEIRYNSEWLAELAYADVIRLLSRFTTARILERDTFAKRQAEGKEIHLHELLYPVMQAYDSVMIRADVELGGMDQTFNNLCGRDLQRHMDQRPQVVVILPILVGTDGTLKMSKSLGNSVGIADPPGEMFGKIMSIPDALMPQWFKLLTTTSQEEIGRLTDPSKSHPRQSKDLLARTIIGTYHSPEAAETAAAEFKRVFGGGGSGLPDELPEVILQEDLLTEGRVVPIDLILACGFASTRSEARRLVADRGVRINREPIVDALQPIGVGSGDVVQRGKRKFVRLVIE